MAQESKGEPGSARLSAWLVAAMLTGLFFVNQPLESVREKQSVTEAINPTPLQTLPARLWQDPLEPARRLDPTKLKGRPRVPQSVEELLRSATLLPAATARPAPGVTQAQIRVLAVAVQGGPYSEDREHRMRMRYALVSAALESGFAPHDSEHIGFLQPDPTLSRYIPFEFFKRRPQPGKTTTPVSGPAANKSPAPASEHVLVLWLDSSTLRQAPLASIRRLLRPIDAPSATIRQTFIGPPDSDTLEAMVEEAYQEALPANKSRAPGRSPSWPFSVVSTAATVPDASMLSRFTALHPDWRDLWKGAPSPPAISDLSTYFQHVAGLHFTRTIGDDRQLTDRLVRELNLRGWLPFCGEGICHDQNMIAVVHESDTVYGREILAGFRASLKDPCPSFNAGSGLPRPESCQANATRTPFTLTYLRGLDGEIATLSDQGEARKGEESKSGTEAAKKPSSRPAGADEQAGGARQLDYLRRQMEVITRIVEAETLKHGTGGRRLQAIGVFGSDTADKILVLQALRQAFPATTLFTTDLDARLLASGRHPWMRNLLVASPFGLEANRDLHVEAPPFRDAYQTSMFVATRLVLGSCLDSGADKHAGPARLPRELLEQPRMYEIGQHGPVMLKESPAQALPAGSIMPHCLLHHDQAGVALKSLHQEDPPTTHGKRLVHSLTIALALALVAAIAMPKCQSTVAGLCTAGGVALLLGFVHCAFQQIAQGADEEPFSWTNGISIWPSEFILFVAALLAAALLYKATVDLAANAHKASEDFFPGSTFQRGRSRHPCWLLRCFGFWPDADPGSPAAAPASANGAEQEPLLDQAQDGSNVKPDVVWGDYLQLVCGGASLMRAAIGAAGLLALFYLLFVADGEPRIMIPARGRLSMQVHLAIMMLSLVTLAVLVCYVLDQTMQCVTFARYLARSRSVWPDRTTREFVGASDARSMQQFADYIDLRLVAERSAVIGNTIYYPFLVLLLILLARNFLFDRWAWPPALAGLLIAMFSFLVFGMLWLRITAEHTRRRALRKLQTAKLLALAGGLGAGDADLIEEVIERTRAISDGAFRPLAEEPFLRALLIPLGGVGGIELTEFLLFKFV